MRGDDDRIAPPGSLPVVVCWIGEQLGGSGPEHADLVVADADVGDVVATIERAPLAAATLAVLLRSTGDVDVETGLALESAAYSLLQAGPEFAAWRGDVVASLDADDRPTVLVDRTPEGRLVVTLDRPHRHNAITARLRDELHAALVARRRRRVDHRRRAARQRPLVLQRR